MRSELFFIFVSSKYEDDDSDDEEATKRFEVDRVTRYFLFPPGMCKHFVYYPCFISKRAASPSYIQEQKALKER